jgi:hypothetical protein
MTKREAMKAAAKKEARVWAVGLIALYLFLIWSAVR